MFAHQFFDSATPVWLKDQEARMYFMQIQPPGEYQGTALSAPKRKDVQPKRYSDEEDTEVSREGVGSTPHKTLESGSFQQSKSEEALGLIWK